MPVYEYQCSECGRVEETFQKISDPPLESCSQCKGRLKKLISQSAFHLKGSGWYVTDYGGSKSGASQPDDAKKTDDSKTKKTVSSKESCSKAASEK